MQRPALLRFKRDSFMEDLAALLQKEPADLGSYVAAPESYREPPAGADPGWTATTSLLKLYQPAHGHFNLVAATLSCRLTGLPDRTVHRERKEVAAFVLRRLEADGSESAWDQQTWTPLVGEAARRLAPNEDLSPMFPVGFEQDGKKRWLHVGLLPISSRETFAAAGSQSPVLPEPGVDPRVDEANRRVFNRISEMQGTQSVDTAALVEASQFVFLDFAELIDTYAPALWNVILNGGTPPTAGTALYTALQTVLTGTTTWADALRTAWTERAILTGEQTGTSTLTYNLRSTSVNPVVFRTAFTTAIGPYNATAGLPGEIPATPKLDAKGERLYVIRCVYRRPACGALVDDVVSRPSAPFALAPFFDPDAPGRPIRITLPADTSIANLRKFKRNVSILISDKLRKQMERVSSLKDMTEGKAGSGTDFDLGIICSLSIPIITICAVIVLFIFLIVLNIIFWWLPFVKICLPLNLKARSS